MCVDCDVRIGGVEFTVGNLFFSIAKRKYFTPVTFAKLLRDDPLGRISIMHLFNYIMKTG